MKQSNKKQKVQQTSWPVAYRWVAMGTLVAYSAIGTQTISVARAQELPPAQGSVPAHPGKGALPVLRFDIPAGSLETVAAAFERTAGVKVNLLKEGLRNLPSPGVSGVLTVEQALQKLLVGTGLAYHFTTPVEVNVDLKSVATSVEVTTSIAALAAATPKYSEPLLDTPQTISAVSQEVMQQQGTTTLRDALRNVAGISLAAGEGGSQGDNLTIRGFTARNDLFIDGMRDFGSYYRDPFNTQEVEVLQGPASVTFGRGSTGGVVNQATKTPFLTRVVSGDVDLGTDLTRRGALDLDTPVSRLGKGTAFRLNLVGQENNVAGRDIAENRRYGVAPSISFGLGSPTRLTLSYFHQKADDTPDYGIPWLFNGPAPVNRHNYYGFEDGNYLRTNDDIGTVKVEHDFNRYLTLRNQARYASYDRDVIITEPKAAATATLATPLSSILVTRNELAAKSTETFLDEQMDLVAKFRTGFLQHNFVTGIEAARETSDPIRTTFTNVPTTSLLSPDTTQAFAGTPSISSQVTTASVSVSAYFLDTIHLGPHLEMSGGFRLDRFDTDFHQLVAPVAAFSRLDVMPAWRAAIVYKPTASGNLYVAAGTSFNPSAESLSLSAGNVNLPPEKNKTYETGAKWDFKGGRMAVRAAIFRTQKENARETDPTNALLIVLSGTQRVDGAHFEMRGRLARRWDILSSYAYLDSSLVSSKFFPAAIGAQLANVPRNTFNFWNNYQMPRRWETGLGANYVSSRTASSTVPLDPITGLVKQVPGYWVFNAMVKHPLTEHIDFQVNINNIANRYYYDQLHPAHIVLGAGRSALVGLKFKF